MEPASVPRWLKMEDRIQRDGCLRESEVFRLYSKGTNFCWRLENEG